MGSEDGLPQVDEVGRRLVIPRQRHLDKDRRRQLWVKLQEFIFSRGFSRLTMEDISRELCCSKSALYALEPSKDALMAGVARRHVHEMLEYFEAQSANVGDPVERLSVHLDVVGGFLARMSPTCYVDMVSHPSTQDVFISNLETTRKRLSEFLNAAAQDGRIREVNIEFVCSAVTLLMC